MKYIKFFEEISITDIKSVGGKNASLGEMIQQLTKQGIRIPTGFAVIADAYWYYLTENNFIEKMKTIMNQLPDVHNVSQLQKVGSKIRELIISGTLPSDLEKEIIAAYRKLSQRYNAREIDIAVRSSATAEDLPNASFAGQQDTFLNIVGEKQLLQACKKSFASLFNDRAIVYRVEQGFDHFKVALSIGVQKMIRSDTAVSGVAFSLDTETGFKDVVMIEASYGLGESIVQGLVIPDEYIVHKLMLQDGHTPIIKKVCGDKKSKIVYAGQRNTIGFSYFNKLKFYPALVLNLLKDILERSKKSFNKFRTSAKEYTDEECRSNDLCYTVKTIAVPQEKQRIFCLTDNEIIELAKQVVIIEKHYSELKDKAYTNESSRFKCSGTHLNGGPHSACNREWGCKSWSPMDIEWAKDGQDGKIYIVQARPETIHAAKQHVSLQQYKFKSPVSKSPLLSGISIGSKIVTGTARVVKSAHDIPRVRDNDIVVTIMTDPDWVPVMKKAAGIITDRGGRTCHAAIVSRELGIAAIVGTKDGTKKIKNGEMITLDCSSGSIGAVYQGKIEYEVKEIALADIPKPPLPVMVNIADPDSAFQTSFLPVAGVGLARTEFIITNFIKIHPMACVHSERIKDKKIKAEMSALTAAYASASDFFVEQLSQGIGMIAAAFYPRPVIVRLSDFKSNEYRNLIGGSYFEPIEENPMIGFRGASRYYHEQYKEAFALECAALLRVRNIMGLKNVKIMVPFVRTVDEAEKVVKAMKLYGLERGKDALELIMMCEIPSNVILIEQFSDYFDGFSIGSNDLTQLILGVDRDSTLVAPLFDERNEAVKKMMALAIEGAHKKGKTIGICGQAPSDYPEIAQFLIKAGIDSLSLNADSVISFLMRK